MFKSYWYKKETLTKNYAGNYEKRFHHAWTGLDAGHPWGPRLISQNSPKWKASIQIDRNPFPDGLQTPFWSFRRIGFGWRGLGCSLQQQHQGPGVSKTKKKTQTCQKTFQNHSQELRKTRCRNIQHVKTNKVPILFVRHKVHSQRSVSQIFPEVCMNLWWK